ncbi:histone demethylase UTY-like [Formica exsecta]|uniref:histone demethylase UTY-like n=1 Tax=Formica exsecta TaxID=72781 RepID=UPI00114297E9|nr:histone demethylase UTY-like [Formica exsecta]
MKDIEWLRVPELNIEADAKTIIEVCKDKGLNSVPKFSLLSVCQREPPNPPNQRLTKEQLSPVIPYKQLTSRNEAFNPEIRELCLKHPIFVIRDLVATLNFDVDLFTTKTLIDTNPSGSIEVRSQMKQTSVENWNPEHSRMVWKCHSHRTYSTIAQYASYQNRKILESMNKEKENIQNNETTSSQSNLDSKKTDQKTINEEKKLLFGTNVDLSNIKIWKRQLEELKKLPSLFQVGSDDNMLNYVGHDILGMNTVQLYIKVPGCRTPGHQENNNFCSVNINIGPGDCEWFAVPYEYWGAICSLCERNGVDYLHGSWWPPTLEQLYRENIPVYRFYQKAGHLVWVNVGCVHWVYAKGFCNNIAWNVGPFTAKQYQAAIERYEWNKLRKFQSIVPMVHLSWNLACNNKVSDMQLHQMIKNCLLLTMRQHYLTLEFVKNKSIKIESIECDLKNTPYCEKCMVEVFGILIVRSKARRNVPYCLDCALKLSPILEGFICVEENNLHNVINIYDNFARKQ